MHLNSLHHGQKCKRVFKLLFVKNEDPGVDLTGGPFDFKDHFTVTKCGFFLQRTQRDEKYMTKLK